MCEQTMLSMYAKSFSDVRQLNIDTLNLAPPPLGKGAGSEERECVDDQLLHSAYAEGLMYERVNEDIIKK